MKEMDVVKLTRDFNGLLCGTLGTVVSEYDGTCFEIEFVDILGNTIDVLTTPRDFIKLV